MSVTAVIVNYYTSAYLPDMLRDLADFDDMDKVFVVDNSGEVDFFSLQNLLPGNSLHGVEILKPGKNIGFGAAVNLAAAKASSEYLLVINPDVKLFPGCLEHLLDAAGRYGSVLTGPRFFWDEAKRYRLPPSQGASSWLDYAFEAATVNRLEFEHISFYWQMRHERFWAKTIPFTEIFLSGACVLIKREWAVRKNSTVFDERFFLYFEDNDISLRAHFDGIPPLCVPAAEALHHYDQSPSPERDKVDLMGISHGKFSKKHYGNLKFLLKKKGLYMPDIDDIGQITDPFSLNPKTFKPVGALYFEIGVNPTFIPFAQTELSMMDHGKNTEEFTLNEAIWKRLAKGVYYVRIRDTIKGVLKIWRWQKV